MTNVTREHCLEVINQFEPCPENKKEGALGIDGEFHTCLSGTELRRGQASLENVGCLVGWFMYFIICIACLSSSTMTIQRQVALLEYCLVPSLVKNDSHPGNIFLGPSSFSINIFPRTMMIIFSSLASLTHQPMTVTWIKQASKACAKCHEHHRRRHQTQAQGCHVSEYWCWGHHNNGGGLPVWTLLCCVVS